MFRAVLAGRTSDPVADAVMVPDRANLVMVAMAGRRCAGGGYAQDGQGHERNDEGFHCDLHNR